MATLREIYCARHKCTTEQFARQAFWHCLYPHARLVAPLILASNYEYFSPDRALIFSAGDAVNMMRIRDEVRDYFWDSDNRGWLRRGANLRVSGQRLQNFACRYLPEGTSAGSPPLSRPDSNPPL